MNECKRLQSVCIYDLALTVCATVWASNVRWNAAFAFRTSFKKRCTPAVSATTHFLLHLRCSTFWYCHGSRCLVQLIKVKGRRLIREVDPFNHLIRHRFQSRQAQPMDRVLRRGGWSVTHQWGACPLLNSENLNYIRFFHLLHRSEGRLGT